MQSERLIAFHEMNLVAVRLKKTPYVIIAATPEDRGSADLISVQVEDRQHRAVANGIQKARSFPRSFQWPGLSFSISNNGYCYEIRIVEHRAEGMHQDVTELSSFMDRARCRCAYVTRNAARCRELPKEARETLHISGNGRIDFSVGTLEVDVRNDGGPAVPRSSEINDVGISLRDQSVEVHIDEAQPRRRTPMSKQPRLYVSCLERLTEKWVVPEIDLADGQIVGGLPVPLHSRHKLWSQRRRGDRFCIARC